VSDDWSFEPITVKDEDMPRMVCYYSDFKKLREKLIEDLIKCCGIHMIDLSDKWIKDIINKRFGVV